MAESNAAESDETTARASTPWELFEHVAARDPDVEAVVDTRRGRFTYGELREHVTGLATTLAGMGIGKGDRFATLLGNGVEQTAALLAASRVGATVATVNYRHPADDVAHVLTDCNPSLVIFDEDTRRILASVREDLAIEGFLYAGDDPPAYADAYWKQVANDADAPPPVRILNSDDPVYLPYTAGTTGKPKGCLYTAGVAEFAPATAATFGFAEERLLPAVPQAHAMGGWFGGTIPVLTGGTVVTIPTFDPVDALEAIENETVTALIAIPATLRGLVDAGAERFETDSLVTVLSGGGPLSPELATAVDEAFEPDSFYTGMVTIEIGWFLSREIGDASDTARSPGTPLPNVDTRIVRLNDDRHADGDPTVECDIGETGVLVVNSPYGMDRYVGSSDAITGRLNDALRNDPSGESEGTGASEPWYYTGDLGYVDEAGRFWPGGRRANQLVSDAIPVSDIHIETVLGEHPAVAEVAVVGVPDERRGERVVACVVPTDEPVIENLIRWAREHPDLTDHERPREVVFFEELPRSATTAVRKFELREWVVGTETN